MKESAFDSLVSGTQDLEFSFLEKKLQETIGIGSLTDDVLRTLGLSTKEGHYNNAAALMADQNSFSELTSRDSVTASTISLTGRLFREFPSSHSMTSPWRCTGSTTSTRSLTVSGEGLLKPFLKPPSGRPWPTRLQAGSGMSMPIYAWQCLQIGSKSSPLAASLRALTVMTT